MLILMLILMLLYIDVYIDKDAGAVDWLDTKDVIE
jgi:hypothetical protein